VMSFYSLTFLGFAPIGSLLLGTSADLVGTRRGFNGTQLALAASGLVIIVFGTYMLLTKPRIRALK